MKIPKGLVNVIKSGNAVAFVGSGLSRGEAGGSSWKCLLKGAADAEDSCDPTDLSCLRRIATAITAFNAGRFLNAAAIIKQILEPVGFQDAILRRIKYQQEIEIDQKAVEAVLSGQSKRMT